MIQVGVAASREMLKSDRPTFRSEVWDRSAASAALRAGLSGADVIDIFCYMPPSPVEIQEEDEPEGEDGPQVAFL